MQNLPGFQTVNVIRQYACEVIDQVSFLFQKRSLIQLPELLKVKNLYYTLLTIDCLESLLLAPFCLPEMLRKILFPCITDTGYGAFRVLP